MLKHNISNNDFHLIEAYFGYQLSKAEEEKFLFKLKNDKKIKINSELYKIILKAINMKSKEMLKQKL